MQTVLRLCAFLIILLQIACATHRVIRDKEYSDSVAAYQRGDSAAALGKFPEGEKNGFITSVEKAWLSVWQQNWNPQELQKQVDTFDERKFISLSREAGYFLMQESEEGYVPSEHEITLLHLLSAIHFAELQRVEDARVELRRAGYILDRYWDDASLRIWLGSLWASLGNWEEAQVDFRRAGVLSNNKNLIALANGRRPPALTLHFYGNGPLTQWNEGSYTPSFLADPLAPKNLPLSAPTLPWSVRHTQRNSELRDILLKSNFMAQYLGSKALTQTERGVNKMTTWGIRAGAVVIGVVLVGGVLYFVIQSGAASASGSAVTYLIGGAAALAYGVWKFGGELDHKLEREVRENDLHKQEDLRIYRMVRFLPTWIGVETANVETPPSHSTLVKLTIPASPTHLILLNHY